MKLAFIFSIFYYSAIIAQYPLDSLRDNVWLFGYTAGSDTLYPHWGGTILRFNNGTIELQFNDINLSFDKTNASICSQDGELLFATNGVYIVNSNYDFFPGIDSLNYPSDLWNGYTYNISQSSLVLTSSGMPSVYYVISTPMDYAIFNNQADIFTPNINFSIVDIDLDNGLGDITFLNQTILENDSLMGGLLTACRHANGRDWWIPVKTRIGNKIYMLLLDHVGLHISHIQEIGESYLYNLVGQARFSPDGSYYIMVGGLSIFDYTISVLNFDRCTGTFSNPRQIVSNVGSQGEYPIGCAVSPNSRYLYLSEKYRLRQCDLWADDVFGSCEVVAEVDDFLDTLHPDWHMQPYFQFMQPGPDGKIYMTTGATHYLSYINQPDLQGTACDVVQHGIQLLSFNAFSIPNYPNFRLGPIDGSPCDTLGIDNVVATKEPPKLIEAVAKVYPNSVSEAVVVQFAQPQVGCTFVLHNALGERVLEWPLSANISTVWVKELQAGVYFYVIHDSDGQKVQSGKLVKL